MPSTRELLRGTFMNIARFVRRTGQAVAVAGCLALAGLATPAFADPPGNNGTVKIDDVEFDDHPNNEPHVGCTFQVDFYGFDKGDLNADVTFRAHPPTGNRQVLLTDTVFIGEDDNSGGGSEKGLDASRTYTLNFDGIQPQPQQGFHVKLTINADGSQGADKKHKVFWVKDCGNPTPRPRRRQRRRRLRLQPRRKRQLRRQRIPRHRSPRLQRRSQLSRRHRCPRQCLPVPIPLAAVRDLGSSVWPWSRWVPWPEQR